MTPPSARKPRTLYVSDLDGTLLSPEPAVTPQTARMLNAAIGAGALFTIATARTPATVAGLLADVRLTLPAAVMTGSALWNPRENTYSQASFHSPEEARRIITLLREMNLPAFIYSLNDDVIDIYHIGPLSDREKKFLEERSHTPYKRVCVPESGESVLPADLSRISLFFAMQPTRQTEAVYRRLRAEADCTPVFYHDMYGPATGMLEVFGHDVSKANAVRRIAAMAGADRIVAFGDNINDLPMLRAADVAVAVGNAVEEVKREADVIIEPNTENSVARAILDDYSGMRPLVGY